MTIKTLIKRSRIVYVTGWSRIYSFCYLLLFKLLKVLMCTHTPLHPNLGPAILQRRTSALVF